jgi:glutamate synthase (NADPH) large chain
MERNSDQIGLFHHSDERDACGVGFVCRLDGRPRHEIVCQGLRILTTLEHRGACGCDEDTGDGAGILLQIPHRFLRAVASDHGFNLPDPGDYAVGMVFLPTEETARIACVRLVEEVAETFGTAVLGWRAVPTVPDAIGYAASVTAPAVYQVFFDRGATEPGPAFERRLFLIRKTIEKRTETVSGGDTFYVASLSSETIVYKGMLTVHQVDAFYPDLRDSRLESALALVHSRFSTNTQPRWRLAQPFRYIAHNGEINTLRGNVNWMKARESLFADSEIQEVLPILKEGASDSATLDNALELLVHSGRSLPHAVMMLIPEAWERDPHMDPDRKAFYSYHSCLMEPWDGPAVVPFTDGHVIGAVLDRNGLRPGRYTVTTDGLVVLASETGVLDIDPADIVEKGRLQPGHMFLVDLDAHRIVRDEEIKSRLATEQPYGAWLEEKLVALEDLPDATCPDERQDVDLRTRQRQFGYTLEDISVLLAPMAASGAEPIGSMGNDTPLAVLSDRPRLLFDYFRQLFAQVTNPPLDAIREELVTSLHSHIGSEGDLLLTTPGHCRAVRLQQPVLTEADLAKICEAVDAGIRCARIDTVFRADIPGELETALATVCANAADAVRDGASVLILSDRKASESYAPMPSLLVTAAVHHHLIREGLRAQTSIVVESGEPREVHHFAVLIGYGASAVAPYLALETVRAAVNDGRITVSESKAVENYVKAIGKGILKVMSKMGISTLRSYQGAQIFEAVGLDSSVVDRYFVGTPSRIGGIGIDLIAEEALARHRAAYAGNADPFSLDLEPGGVYQWRRNGEGHAFNPLTIGQLQHAVRQGEASSYEEYARLINDQQLYTLRGLTDFVPGAEPVPLDEVEPWTEIVKRFKTGAMSYGSISEETHETLAVAMNRIDGKSNTGEGGEDPSRYDRASEKRSRIKQVASGRFGVTISYLASADEIQIKMAQGAKPGEGGQLPGEKVYPWIAKTRHSTPWVGLISPPPHHDIYSIEDLAQLIHDLKNANPTARVTVKLVAEVGVGTIASGVAKGKADVILISGHDGGTGASPQTSIAHAGLPWELGLSETHQALTANGLRSRVLLECDGQLKTGRDVAIAALLGADEFGFATAPLVAMGCIMMRKCHLNTCPVGIATQDPELRKKFEGRPEHVINYFHFVAEELRRIMASLGFRSLSEMIGRADRLEPKRDVQHWKARHLDLRPLLAVPTVPEHLVRFAADAQDHGLDRALDHTLLAQSRPALSEGRRVRIRTSISNVNRTVGTILSNAIANRHGVDGLPDAAIDIAFKGSAGQSFGAFAAPGLSLRLEGDANDYVGKGLSGGRIVIQPPKDAIFKSSENILIGNVALYGATSGELFVAGRAGERFAVRNSGARAVVEGVGDHGCEYMTGGRVVVLGTTGRNFAAGMSGGVAYVLDPDARLKASQANTTMVELLSLEDGDAAEIIGLVERHHALTGSPRALDVLENLDEALAAFVKVMPTEYRRALRQLARETAAADAREQLAA